MLTEREAIGWIRDSAETLDAFITHTRMFGNALIKHGEALKGHAGLYMKLIQDNPITMEMLRLVELDNNYRQILSESVELIKNDMDHFLVDYENLLGKM